VQKRIGAQRKSTSFAFSEQTHSKTKGEPTKYTL